MTHKGTTKLTVKDTVFRDLFFRKKYLLQMYKTLHPEDKTVKTKDLNIVHEQVALHGRTLKAAKEIIRICRDRDLLKEYLNEREQEVEGIMLTLFDQEHVLNVERDNIRAAALAEGMIKKQTQVIVNMFRHNMSMQDIADINDLPVEEVSAILKKAAVLH